MRISKSHIRLPRVLSGEVFAIMDAGNISRLHLGKDPLPYTWYKRLLQMSRCGMLRHLDKDGTMFVKFWCKMTRKQRRENQDVRRMYMLYIANARLSAEIDRQDRLLETLHRQLEHLPKSRKK